MLVSGLPALRGVLDWAGPYCLATYRANYWSDPRLLGQLLGDSRLLGRPPLLGQLLGDPRLLGRPPLLGQLLGDPHSWANSWATFAPGSSVPQLQRTTCPRPLELQGTSLVYAL